MQNKWYLGLLFWSAVGCHSPSPADSAAHSAPSVPSTLHVKNKSTTHAVRFWIKAANDYTYRNIDSMLATALRNTTTDEQKAFALWKMVTLSGQHSDYPYFQTSSDNVDPLTLATFPYFMCGEKAGILLNLAEWAGLQARIIHLNGHIANEFFYAQQWHFFDADEGCYFVDSAHRVLSANALYQNPRWISPNHLQSLKPFSVFRLWQYKNYIKKMNPEPNSDLFRVARHHRAMDIALGAQEEVKFVLRKNKTIPMWSRYPAVDPLEGRWTTRLAATHQNIKAIAPQTYELTMQFPYFVKQLTIESTKPLPISLVFTAQNTSTGRLFNAPIAATVKDSRWVKNFGAPTTDDLFYSYKLIIKNCLPEDLAHLVVVHGFWANSQTFAGTKSGQITIYADRPAALAATQTRP